MFTSEFGITKDHFNLIAVNLIIGVGKGITTEFE